jgi:hypothetical protein
MTEALGYDAVRTPFGRRWGVAAIRGDRPVTTEHPAAP